jgi:hypothetical protein
MTHLSPYLMKKFEPPVSGGSSEYSCLKKVLFKLINLRLIKAVGTIQILQTTA